MTSDVYARVQAHDGDSAVAAAACSYDGEWLLSCDDDGLLAVNRLRRDPFEVGKVLMGKGKGGVLKGHLSS